MPLQTTTSITDYLKSKGQPSDFTYRRKRYEEAGLGKRLGGYVGSGQQNVALLNWYQGGGWQGKIMADYKAANRRYTMSRNPLTDEEMRTVLQGQKGGSAEMVSALDRAQQEKEMTGTFGAGWRAQAQVQMTPQQRAEVAAGVPTRVSPITGMPAGTPPAEKPQVLASRVQPTTPTAEGQVPEELVRRFEEIRQKALGVQEAAVKGFGITPTIPTRPGEPVSPTPAAAITPTPEAPTAEAPAAPTPEVVSQVQLGEPDLAGIIDDISTGEIKVPELEIAEEAKRMAMAGEERRATSELKRLQQALAKRGMTFSGIRTTAEQNAAADSLARKAGISRTFASAILTAARQETTRRETALRQAQTAQATALRAMGYVQIGGELFKTVERERLEEPPAPPAAPTSVREYEYARQQGYTGTFEEWERMGRIGTVGWSQWAAELGVTGMSYEEAMPIIMQDAKSKKKDMVSRQMSSVKGNLFMNIQDGALDPKDEDAVEAFIDKLMGEHDALDRATIANLVYGEIAKLRAPEPGAPSPWEVAKQMPASLWDVVKRALGFSD